MPFIVLHTIQILYLLVYAYVHAQMLSHVQLFATPWTVAHQVPLFMGYWRGVAISSFRGSSQPKIKPKSPVSPALAGRFLTTEPPGKPVYLYKGMFLMSVLAPRNYLSLSCHFIH